MINKRLIKINHQHNHYIAYAVLSNIIILLTNVVMLAAFSLFFSHLILNTLKHSHLFNFIGVLISMLLIRIVFTRVATLSSFHAASKSKALLRRMVYDHLLLHQQMNNSSLTSSHVVQLASEGIEQLELYYGRYLPQFFYSLLAPLFLFVVLMTIDLKVALALLLAVPLIPISILVVQKIAKKLLGKYWKSYTSLGERFFDLISSLTTLKLYRSDQHYLDKMDQEAESFRKATMKVLVMQLNSIVVMDLVAYLGASVGIFLGIVAYANHTISLGAALFVVFISADFFIPLRQLGSLFHVAMNGIAASKTIFQFLDETPPKEGTHNLKNIQSFSFNQAGFQYKNAMKPTFNQLDLTLPQSGFVTVVGKSGSGKSTLAYCMTRQYNLTHGDCKINGKSINDISYNSLHHHITLINHHSFIFEGTIKENLIMANSHKTDEQLKKVMQEVGLESLISNPLGLETIVFENGSNLSTGQRQRLLIARAILKESEIILCDEITANIDYESEDKVMNILKKLAEHSCVVFITHRLQHCIKADQIMFFKSNGRVVYSTHHNLMNQEAEYNELFSSQQQLETVLEVKHATSH